MHPRHVRSSVHVGRGEAIAVVADSAAMAREGGTTLLIAGEAGIGKSRLVLEAVRMARDAGFTLLLGHCRPEATAPHAPIVDALRYHVRTVDDESLREHFAGAARLAAALLPEVIPVLPEAPAVELIPEDVYGAIAQFLARLTRVSPALLLLEDVHWASADTLALVAHLVTATSDLPVWIVATYRTEELRRGSPLVAFLGAVARGHRCRELLLSGLGHEGVSDLVSAIFDGVEVTDRFVDAILTRTGGNPLFVEELCRVIATRGNLLLLREGCDERDLASLEMPLTMRQTLLAQVRDVDQEALRVLGLASVAGEELDLEVLSAAAELRPGALTKAIVTALDHHILIERRDGPRPGYAFRHALIREALADQLIGPERQVAHRRIGDAIRQAHAGDLDQVAGLLADHYRAAGEPRLAAEPCRLAARSARRALALGEAVARYDQAQSIEADAHTRLSILVEAAEAFQGPEALHAALPYASQAAAVAREFGDLVAEARALMVQSLNQWWQGGHHLVAIAIGREALSLVQGRGDRWEVLALTMLVRHLALGDQPDEALGLLPGALAMAAELCEEEALARLHNTRGCLAVDERDCQEAFDTAIAVSRAAHAPQQAFLALLNFAGVDIWLGRLERACTTLVRAGRMAAPHFIPCVELQLASARALMGDLDEALAIAERYQDVAGPLRMDVLTVMAEVHLRRGQDREAGTCAEESWRLAQAVGETQRTLPALAALVRSRLTEGVGAARALLPGLLDETRRARPRCPHWPYSPDVAGALAQAGHGSELEEWVDAIREVTVAPFAHNLAALRHCEAIASLHRGDHEAARGSLHEARDLYQAMPCRAREAEAWLVIADVEWRAGAARESAAAARAAAQLDRRVGSPRLAEAATAALRRTGTRVPGASHGRRATGPGGLSMRETEVARLVAQGCSNAGIARRLHLSEHTAAKHVTHILTKLDLHTRVQIARWATEQELLANS